MFKELDEISRKPAVFEHYTAHALWAKTYRARQMLAFHLDDSVDVSSRSGEFIEASSRWIVDRFGLGPDSSVCDFGCGPGLYTSRFARTGARVTGIDFSKGSIRYARDRAEEAGQTIDYIQANYLEAELTERFDLITMIMFDFCALSLAQRKTLLQKFHACLKEDGAVLLDVYSTAAFEQLDEVSFLERNQLNHFWFEEEYFCFVNTFKYEDEAVALDKYSIFTESGRTETVYNWLQYFSRESLSDELRASGFDVEGVYADVSGRPYFEDHTEFAIVARKGKDSG